MKLAMQNWKNGVAAFAVAGLLVTGSGYVVNAQSETAVATETTNPRDVVQAAIADALGLTAEELQDQLWAGQTLADLAEAAGVDVSELRDAAEAAQQALRIEQIQASVEAGEISQEQADWMIEGIEQGYMSGGFGRDGFGRGGFGMEPQGMQQGMGGRGGHDFGRGMGQGEGFRNEDGAPGMRDGRGPAQPNVAPDDDSSTTPNSNFVQPATPDVLDGML